MTPSGVNRPTTIEGTSPPHARRSGVGWGAARTDLSPSRPESATNQRASRLHRGPSMQLPFHFSLASIAALTALCAPAFAQNDDCLTPTTIVGTGVFPFDDTQAST